MVFKDSKFKSIYSSWKLFPVIFEKMVISGRYDYDNWISSYRLNYSLDGFNWISYKNSQIFIGNTDYIEPVEQIFEPFIARSVRILPATWNNYIGGKFEFLISQIIYSKSLLPNNLILAVSSGFKLTVSSVWDNGCQVSRAAYDIKISRAAYGAQLGVLQLVINANGL